MKQALKKLISDNQTDQAIDELERITKDLPVYNTVVMIAGNFQRYKQDQQRGTKSGKELAVDIAKIQNGLLSIIDDLPATAFSGTPTGSAASEGGSAGISSLGRYSWLAGALVLAVAALAWFFWPAQEQQMLAGPSVPPSDVAPVGALSTTIPAGFSFQVIAQASLGAEKSVSRVVFDEGCSEAFLQAELKPGDVEGDNIESLLIKIKNKIIDQDLVQHDIKIEIAEDTGVCTILCFE